MAIDEDYQSTWNKVATIPGEDCEIDVWANEERSYEGTDSDKLGIWGTVVGVDMDECIGAGACIDACPVEVFEWFDTPNSTASKQKPLMLREPECIICRACESVCPVQTVLITED